MKQVLGLAISFVLFLLTSPAVRAVQSAPLFSSQITINQDTSLSIRETLIFSTDEDRHGIYRYVPQRYSVNGLSYTAKIYEVTVENEAGESYEFDQQISGNNLTLKIGDPDMTFTGQQTYIISYRVRGAVKRFADHDELFWDITGEGWQFPLEYSRVTIDSPFANIQKQECFSGAVGSNDGDCQLISSNAKTVSYEYLEPIEYGENMSVVLALQPDNQLQFPTRFEKFMRDVWDNIVLGILALPAIGMTAWWWSKGRDRLFISRNVFNQELSQPQIMSVPWLPVRVPFVYEPIKELSPGEAGVILDETADAQDVIAEILELARLKYLKIVRQEKKQFLGSSNEYFFEELRAADAKLSPVQFYLQTQLFKSRKKVSLSELKGSFYTHLSKAQEMLTDSLTTKGLFTANPTTMRLRGLAMVGVSGFGLFFFLIEALNQGLFLAIPVAIGSLVISLLAANFLPAKTAQGSNIAMQARGLKETISRGKWREEIKEKHLFIEQIFPFAVSLGVVDMLVRDLDKLGITPPSYLSSGASEGVALHSFMSGFSSAASSSLSYNPSSSSASGGSGFSGGSSGGGGGGGGGGSW